MRYLIYCLCLIVPFVAEKTHAYSLKDPIDPASFAIALSSFDTEWVFDDNDTLRQVNIDAIEIIWTENFKNAWGGGLYGGYLDVSQPSNPIPAGKTMSGGYLGIFLKKYLVSGDRFTLDLGGYYRYALIDSDQDNQSIETRWHEYGLSLKTRTRFSQSMSLLLGANATQISGDERASGPVDQVRDFESKDNADGYLGLEIELDPRSHVGVQIHGGRIDGGLLYFQYSYF